VDESPEAKYFEKEQSRVLAKYGVAAKTRFVQLTKPSLRTHVLDAGRGEPVLMIHGGGTVAVSLAGVMTGLAPGFRCVAPDRPGCGLTDGFDYINVPFRQHAIQFVRGILDALNIQQASLIGNSMGGPLSLYFSLGRARQGYESRTPGRAGGQRAPSAAPEAAKGRPMAQSRIPADVSAF
jgi:pimeloyl-ACP methyl ester carboxylesterase